MRCRKCIDANNAACSRSHRHREYGQRIRIECIGKYGGKCVVCSEDNPKYLQLDHIANDGVDHREQLTGKRHGISNPSMYRWALKNGCPPSLQLLCANCHLTKTKQTSPGINSPGGHRYRQKRGLCVQQYGGKCACCGDSSSDHLHLDHVNNDGAEHRRIIFRGQRSVGGLATWALKNGCPPSLQLLCANCHQAKTFYGGCDHQTQAMVA
jgi:5-methylcytosine-specific restriction endonuclease McrA